MSKEKEPEIDLATINTFRQLAGPCLVCGKMPPGAAKGITPNQAVCMNDITDEPEKAKAALEAAARGETVVKGKVVKGKAPTKRSDSDPAESDPGDSPPAKES